MNGLETGKQEEILSVLEAVLRGENRPVALHEPYFAGREREYVRDCINSGYVSSVGQYVGKFETELSRFT